MDIFDVAYKQQRESGSQQGSGQSERHLLVVGSKSCGKTSLILRFLDSGETAKSTVALEYRFARRSKPNTGAASAAAKEIGHVWELGGGVHLTSLIDKVITPARLPYLTVVICLDLSQPQQLWTVLDKLLYTIRVRVKSLLSEDPSLEERLPKNPLRLATVLIGCKFDLFHSQLDPEQWKIISKSLRAVALEHAAPLLFVSAKQEALVGKLKQVLTASLFPIGEFTSNDDQFVKSVLNSSGGAQTDHQKPLFVPAGLDSIENIGNPPANLSAGGSNLSDRWQAAFVSMFQQDVSGLGGAEQRPFEEDKFREKAIDDLRREKDAELEQYRRVSHRKLQELQQQLDAGAIS